MKCSNLELSRTFCTTGTRLHNWKSISAPVVQSPSSQRRGGCAVNEKPRSDLVPRRRARSASAIARSLKSGRFGANAISPVFLLRLRPTGLAFRATPAAPLLRRFRDIFLMSRPHLCEGNVANFQTDPPPQFRFIVPPCDLQYDQACWMLDKCSSEECGESLRAY